MPWVSMGEGEVVWQDEGFGAYGGGEGGGIMPTPTPKYGQPFQGKEYIKGWKEDPGWIKDPGSQGDSSTPDRWEQRASNYKQWGAPPKPYDYTPEQLGWSSEEAKRFKDAGFDKLPDYMSKKYLYGKGRDVSKDDPIKTFIENYGKPAGNSGKHRGVLSQVGEDDGTVEWKQAYLEKFLDRKWEPNQGMFKESILPAMMGIGSILAPIAGLGALGGFAGVAGAGAAAGGTGAGAGAGAVGAGAGGGLGGFGGAGGLFGTGVGLEGGGLGGLYGTGIGSTAGLGGLEGLGGLGAMGGLGELTQIGGAGAGYIPSGITGETGLLGGGAGGGGFFGNSGGLFGTGIGNTGGLGGSGGLGEFGGNWFGNSGGLFDIIDKVDAGKAGGGWLDSILNTGGGALDWLKGKGGDLLGGILGGGTAPPTTGGGTAGGIPDWLKALLGIGGGVAGGVMGNNAIQDAIDKMQKYYQPFYDLGVNNIPAWQAADPTGGQKKFADELAELGKNFKFDPTDPAYVYKMDEMTKAANQNLAARGMYNSSAGLNLLDRGGRGIMAEEYDKQYQNKYGALSDQWRMAGQTGGTEYNKLLDALKIGSGASGSAGAGALAGGQSTANLWSGLGSMPLNYFTLSSIFNKK
jgi:hypothetical protein